MIDKDRKKTLTLISLASTVYSELNATESELSTAVSVIKRFESYFVDSLFAQLNVCGVEVKSGNAIADIENEPVSCV